MILQMETGLPIDPYQQLSSHPRARVADNRPATTLNQEGILELIEGHHEEIMPVHCCTRRVVLICKRLQFTIAVCLVKQIR